MMTIFLDDDFRFPISGFRDSRIPDSLLLDSRTPMKSQETGSGISPYLLYRHTLIEIHGHKHKQPKRPKRNRLLKEVSLFMFYRFAGIQPEDLEEDEERRTPHSATNSTGSPPK